MKSITTLKGFSIVELMIAMALGVALISAALTLYARSSDNARIAQSMARLQEHARYALSVIEPSIEHAGFYGFVAQPELLRLIQAGNPWAVVASSTQLSQVAPRLAMLPSSMHTCGTNFATDILRPVQASNGVFILGPTPQAGCAPYGAGVVANSDTLTLRHASWTEESAEAGRVQIYSSRLAASAGAYLFVDGVAPGLVDAHHSLRNMVVRTFYIAQDSVQQAGYPALRVKSLGRRLGVPTFDEDEIISGIEDLQVQFGIDTGGGTVMRYVSADFPGLADHTILAVRLWLRVRASEPDYGFNDTQTYQYADISYIPSGRERHYRRVVVSRTVAIRNAGGG
jgi:type IV pilus assembly protein PilW